MVPRCPLLSLRRGGRWSILAAAILVVLAPGSIPAGESSPGGAKQGADLVKTDIMGVFAHPDDETGMAGTLAWYALGKKSVVANVYCTRGEGGGNMVGTQSGPALGHLREAELRDCLATLGVRYCYFLDQLDWAYTESVAATLEKWGKEPTLERLVRLVRELRPNVMVTMNPAPSPGQHGHHQAAGVLATEAFSAAADPNRFPGQLSSEGLTVWQCKKLYYGGGSTGLVATVSVTGPLPTGDTPAKIAARALAHHRSQAFGNFADSPWLQRPQRFTLVKSFVPISASEDDLLAHAANVELAEVRFPRAAKPAVRLEFTPRPAVANYYRWAAAQNVEHVADQFAPDLPVVCGEANLISFEVINDGVAPVDGTAAIQAPPGWRVEPAAAQIALPPGQRKLVQLAVVPPSNPSGRGELVAGGKFGDAVARSAAALQPVPRALVQRVPDGFSLEGSAEAWATLPVLEIPSTNSWQGKVTNSADNSATVRLAHDGRRLFLRIDVKDDQVISNIAPEDIKGHWRSDSVEICLDPAAGAEHTMGCYKLGVFPFDSTGVVRAARDADANPGPLEKTAPQTQLRSNRTADGYQIIAAIPFGEIGLRPDQKRLGFNVLIYDGDKPDAAPGENINKSRLAWSPRPGVMGRPEDWGRIDLE